MNARAAATTIALAALLGTSGATAQPKGDGKDSVVSTCVRSFEDAQIEQKKGRLVSAVESYRTCAREDCPALVRTDCVQALDAAERALPTVSVIVRDRAGRDVDVAITLDDKPVEAGKGKAIPVDPGEHVVGFEAGGRRQIRSFTAHEGEKSRLVVLAFEDGASEQPVAGPTRGRRSIWPWVLGGAGVVAVAAGTVMVLGYDGKESRLRERFEAANRCDGDGVAGCSAEEDARRKQLKDEYAAHEQRASDATPVTLSFIIGGALAIAGAVVWMVLDRKPASAPSSALLVPTLARGRTGGVLQLAF